MTGNIIFQKRIDVYHSDKGYNRVNIPEQIDVFVYEDGIVVANHEIYNISSFCFETKNENYSAICIEHYNGCELGGLRIWTYFDNKRRVAVEIMDTTDEDSEYEAEYGDEQLVDLFMSSNRPSPKTVKVTWNEFLQFFK